MPPPGMMWRHVIISTRRSWLHGDARGFRSRKHRIHSSGDYRNPPPPGEHGGLHRYHEKRAKGEVIKIPRQLRAELGAAVVAKVLAMGYRVLVLSVSAKHLHALVELPIDPAKTRSIVGKWKTVRTRAVRTALPGSIWGEGGKYKPAKDRAHQRAAFKYIRDDQGPVAWVWTFQGPG
jgi:REP element-mobilizing transposase RayT